MTGAGNGTQAGQSDRAAQIREQVRQTPQREAAGGRIS